MTHEWYLEYTPDITEEIFGRIKQKLEKMGLKR